ncbi:MAG TPA: anhydro-N-acetylmuramic acid kinase [Candidatus Cybelea sp.]|jgi:anhydro-N-acetylmuramic acid kinase
MSGTSLDGIDAALVRIEPRAGSYALELLRFETFAYAAALKRDLVAALPPNPGSVAALANLHNALGRAYARATGEIRRGERVDFVASHGQTIWHDGPAHVTLQIGDAFVIREAVAATVCYDFRSADTAAGGHGAPLVSYVDALLLGSAGEDRVALNLGGIANVTLLRKGAAANDAIAFDTGPGNMLLDAFLTQRTAGRKCFDADGALGRKGRTHEGTLEAMLGDEFFLAPPPKTTGRERFGRQYLSKHAARLDTLTLEDGAATLTELTAVAVAFAIRRAGFAGAALVVSGGGARNSFLLERLAARIAPGRLERSDAFSLPADAKEAIAFAVLGYETLRGRAANVPAATGARRRVVLGALAPYDLPDLFERLRLEVGAEEIGADHGRA